MKIIMVSTDDIDLLNSFGVLTGTNISKTTPISIMNEDPESNGFMSFHPCGM